MIPLSVPHLNGNEWKYVKDCLDTGWISSAGSYVNQFETIWNKIQDLIDNDYILAGHDRSDGGLITTIIEMSIASQYGCRLNITNLENMYNYFFNEELGIVLEIDMNYSEYVFKQLVDINYTILGYTCHDKSINITYNNQII